MLNILKSIKVVLRNENKLINSQLGALFHTTNVLDKKVDERKKLKKWIGWNREIYEPQKPDEERRPAYVCHLKANVRYSPKKMWYVSTFIRGMSIDEALKQLSFVLKKGAAAVKETLLEAQEMAVKEHNVEFKSNLWVAESFCGRGVYFRGIRRHGRSRVGQVEYKHCHYFVKLEEGPPPKHYYLPYPKTPEQQLDDWMASMRKRKVINSL